MGKNSRRKAIPQELRHRVLSAYHYRCAVCGTHGPQLHHINEDPSCNEELNLLPLCPNCHLRDQHNPTEPMNPKKLRFFREYRDPFILKPQFDPLWVRMEFLVPDEGKLMSNLTTHQLHQKVRELVDFISYLKMGDYFSKQIRQLTEESRYLNLSIPASPGDSSVDFWSLLVQRRAEIFTLITELLRFQEWHDRAVQLTISTGQN